MAATHPPNLQNSPQQPQRPARRPDMARLAVRSEPGKWPAAALAVIVHIGFFALIVFGVTWQVKSPMPLSAEIWGSLPPIRNLPTPPPPVEPEPEAVKLVAKPAPPIEKVLPPALPTRAEIELKTKRERDELARQQKLEKELAEKKKRDETNAADERKKAEDEKKRRDLETKQKLADTKLRSEQAARDAEALAAKNAEFSKASNEYVGKVRELIRSRANIPDTVTGRPKIQVRLRLLVNGVVFDAKVLNPSGNPVYDEAFERAINGIQQWPLPANPAILGGQRELILKFEHER